MRGKKQVIFICSGNICRSPMAEVLLRERIEKRSLDLETSSAGTLGIEDHAANPDAVTAAAEVALDLQDVTLVCQDWGGPIGMGVVAREMDRFSRICAANTMLHTAESGLAGRIEWAAHAEGELDSTVSTALLDWRMASTRSPDFEASPSIPFATARGVTDEVAAAYDAPFPSEWHKAGMRQYPILIPVTESDEGAAINRETWSALARFDRPFLTLFGDSDPPTRGWAEIFQERVPGAKGQPHQTLERAGHYWQEDCGAEAAAILVEWIRDAGA